MFYGQHKWWVVEARFARPLTKREVRRIVGQLPLPIEDGDRIVGRDGLVTDQWPDKWPTAADGAVVLGALRSAGVPFKWRAAPYGRDCDTACAYADEQGGNGHCERGSNATACPPSWTDADWQGVPDGV